MFVHIVRPGESLWKIARSYGLYPISDSINKIYVENKLWRVPYIFPGQRLMIPVDSLYYIVRPGDNLWNISRRFNVSLSQLIAYNNISSPYLIYPGQRIKFPKGLFDPSKYLICIDPGHQEVPNLEKEPIGPGSDIMKRKVDYGTMGVYTKKPEYVLNLEVALKVKQILELKGYNVLMTRETHDVNISNKERAELANNANVDLCVRIHAFGSESREDNGIFIMYPSKESPYTDSEKYEESKKLAELVLDNLIKSTKANSQGIVPKSDITGFNWSENPVILVEMGYMTNPEEDKKMSTPEYQYKLAEGIADGIEEYLLST